MTSTTTYEALLARDSQWDELARFAGVGVSEPQNPAKVRGVFSYIDADATIGERTIISPFCYIGPRVKIGDDCYIGPGSVIGGPGFGYEEGDNGEQVYRTHTQGVIIGDDVHIGANTCVDQGRHRPTEIRRGTRVDNLCHIAHNVIVGEDCLIIAQSMLAGTVVIGHRTRVAPCAAVLDHITVGKGCLVGMGSVVVRDVSDGQTVKGVPAK